MIARRSLLNGAVAALAMAALAACASQPYSVDGTVSYRERLILPADSVIMVRLEDVTRGTGAPVTVAEQRILPTSSGVLRYSMPYSPQAIDPHATYVVNAWIEQGGRVAVLVLVVLFLNFRPSGLFPARGRLADA